MEPRIAGRPVFGMNDLCDKGRMSGHHVTQELSNLYRQAFAEFGALALWSLRPVEQPTKADALAITRALRTHGTMAGRRLAEQIERLCRAP